MLVDVVLQQLDGQWSLNVSINLFTAFGYCRNESFLVLWRIICVVTEMFTDPTFHDRFLWSLVTPNCLADGHGHGHSISRRWAMAIQHSSNENLNLKFSNSIIINNMNNYVPYDTCKIRLKYVYYD